MANENDVIRITPASIKIDEVGRVIIDDPVFAEVLVRSNDLNLGGELSCNVNIGTCVPITPTINTGGCGGKKLDEIEVSDKFKDFIKIDDIRVIENLDSIREHILRDGSSRGGPAVDRPI
ncbi:hypothetical protein ACOMCU_25210 [Lysinibacillus sp. UGB7]|uniref:hypothetical protein n=1 Tax=Lysinibacillus sp. UGB7 TaxID=3411039 RepID=UPI003B814533